MTVVTLFGTAAQIGEVAETRHRGRVTQARRFNSIDPAIPYRLPVNIEHYANEEIGEAVYCEVANDGRLGVVAVVDARLVQQTTKPLFFSSEYEWNTRDARADGVAVTIPRIRLTGFGVTYSPAAWAAKPLTWMPGDIRESADRDWPIGEVSARPLLRHAVEAKYEIRSRPMLVDLRWDNMHHAEKWELFEDQDWDRRAEYRRPSGKLEIRPCTVISVR